MVRSPEIAVTGEQCYVAGAWVRGELDEEDSHGGWTLRMNFYDGESLGWQDAAAGTWVKGW